VTLALYHCNQQVSQKPKRIIGGYRIENIFGKSNRSSGKNPRRKIQSNIVGTLSTKKPMQRTQRGLRVSQINPSKSHFQADDVIKNFALNPNQQLNCVLRKINFYAATQNNF